MRFNRTANERETRLPYQLAKRWNEVNENAILVPLNISEINRHTEKVVPFPGLGRKEELLLVILGCEMNSQGKKILCRSLVAIKSVGSIPAEVKDCFLCLVRSPISLPRLHFSTLTCTRVNSLIHRNVFGLFGLFFFCLFVFVLVGLKFKRQ